MVNSDEKALFARSWNKTLWYKRTIYPVILLALFCAKKMTTDKFTSKQAHWITPVFFVLGIYTFGASVMDSFVVYHTWRFVGETEFIKMHMESSSRIVPIFVLPTLVTTIFLVLQFWHRPKVVPRTLLWIALVCMLIAWLSSAFIQIPMQAALDQGKNDQLLKDLIVTDWIRVVPSFILAVVVFIMIRKSIIS